MAIKDLDKLMKEMSPELMQGEYVFVSTNDKIDLEAKMIFEESEGTTYILEKSQADELELDYEAVWKMITLTVNSDLEAVGFLAKITEALAKEGISVNAVSAFYHDHLFILEKDADKAIEVLRGL